MTVIDMHTRVELPAFPVCVQVPAAPWWVCPTWCAGNCTGGDTFALPDGSNVTSDCRLHERVLLADTAADDLNGRPVAVELRMERADALDDLTPVATDVVLRLGRDAVRLTRAQRTALATALLAANDLDEVTA